MDSTCYNLQLLMDASQVIELESYELLGTSNEDLLISTVDELLRQYCRDLTCMNRLWKFVLFQLENDKRKFDGMCGHKYQTRDVLNALQDKDSDRFLKILGKHLTESGPIAKANIHQSTSTATNKRCLPSKRRERNKPEMFLNTLEHPNFTELTYVADVSCHIDTAQKQKNTVQNECQDAHKHAKQFKPSSILTTETNNKVRSSVIKALSSTVKKEVLQTHISNEPKILQNFPSDLLDQTLTETVTWFANTDTLGNIINEQQPLQSQSSKSLNVDTKPFPNDSVAQTKPTAKFSSVNSRNQNSLITQEFIDSVRSEIAVSKLVRKGTYKSWKESSRLWTEKLFLHLFTTKEIIEGTLSGRSSSNRKYNPVKIYTIATFLGWLKSEPVRYSIEEFRKYEEMSAEKMNTGLNESDMSHFRKMIQHYSWTLRQKLQIKAAKDMKVGISC